ncbi:hypothetical protein HNP40_003913 [Mycobacteroides chelonae]|nr:hypothetical protein [Mycobacteroides chelonae]
MRSVAVVAICVQAWMPLGCAPGQKQDSAPVGKPSRQEVLTALSPLLRQGKCDPAGVPDDYRACFIETTDIGGTTTASATYVGQFDDSVTVSRLAASMTRKDGHWQAGDPNWTYQCGRPDSTLEFVEAPCP